MPDTEIRGADPTVQEEDENARLMLLRHKAALTVPDAAWAISCSRSKMYEMISQGKIKPVKLGSGAKSGIRITWNEIERCLKSLTIR